MNHITDYQGLDKALIKGVKTYLIYNYTNDVSAIKAALLTKALMLRYGADFDLKTVDTNAFKEVPASLSGNFFWLDTTPAVTTVNLQQSHFFRGANLAYIAGGEAKGPKNMFCVQPDWFITAGLFVDGLGHKAFEQVVSQSITQEYYLITSLKGYVVQNRIRDISLGKLPNDNTYQVLVELFTKFGDNYVGVIDKIKTSTKEQLPIVLREIIGCADFIVTDSGATVVVAVAPSHTAQSALAHMRKLSVDAAVVITVRDMQFGVHGDIVTAGKLERASLLKALGYDNVTGYASVDLKALKKRLQAL